jgi:hypothetical protein
LRLLLDEEFQGESAPFFSLVGKFKRVSKSPEVLNPEAGKRLWDFSEGQLKAARALKGPVFTAANGVLTAAE